MRGTRESGFRLTLLAALALALAVPGRSGAQVISPAGVEFDDADMFKPTTDPGPFLSVYDSRVLPRGRFTLGVWGDYAHEPLSARVVSGGQEDTEPLVDSLGTVSLVGAIGVASRFQIGVHLPLYLVGESDVVVGLEPLGDTNFNLGDFTVNGKIDLVPRDGLRRFGLALLPVVGFPTGNRREFSGLGDWSYGGILAADWDLDRWKIGLNVGGLIRDGFGGRDESDHFEDQLRWGLAVSRAVSERVALLGEFVMHTDFDEEFHSPAEVIGAVRWNVGRVDLTFGAGGGLNEGKNAALFRAVFGVTTAVAAAQPAPPRMAGSRKSYVVEDHDRNGQVSPGDVIVYTITLVNGGAEPAREVVVSDPIPAYTDYVPNTLRVNGLPVADAAGYSVSPARVGVRIPAIGVGAGSSQATINFKVRIRGDVTTAVTVRNEATVSAATISEFPLPPVDTAVFPVAAQREQVVQTPGVAKRKLEVTQNIQFEPDTPLVSPESYPVLDQVVSILKEQPGLAVSIVGHTDNQGDDQVNLELSQKRAEAVKSYLVGHGIDASRLAAVGRGEFEPVATNDTEAGRAANRRVEFLITSGQ